MTKLDYGLEKGGSPDHTGYGEEDVRALAEERARKRIEDATYLYGMVENLELEIWPILALAMRHINDDALGIKLKEDMLRIHTIVLYKATELEMPAVRRELAIGKKKYWEDD